MKNPTAVFTPRFPAKSRSTFIITTLASLLFYSCSVMLVPVFFSGCRTAAPVVQEPVVVQKPIVVQEPVAVQRPVVVQEPVREVPPPDTLMPLTLSILQRLGESFESNKIERHQLVLSGKITMERELTQKNDEIKRGIAILENEYIKEVITINDQTKGQALTFENLGGRAVISVCFEEVGEFNEDYYFSFSCRADETDDYFTLDYAPSGAYAPGEEKGTLEYGGNSYTLEYSGDRPYLLIRLSQRDTERSIYRIVPGRIVN